MFFEHEQDHLPGTLIVEVYRQAAIRAASRSGALDAPVAVMTRCDAAFADFAEFEGRTECSAAVRSAAGDRVAVSVGLHQFGRQLTEAARAN